MKTNSKECATLSEYRVEVLRKPQSEVARNAGCCQGWISQVERGHMPRPWNRAKLLAAYRLADSEVEFERLVANAARISALQKPISETEPLLACARATTPAPVVTIENTEIRKVLGA
jgi:hypothetical protein